MQPYVETHPIRHVWLVVALVAGAIELVGAGRRRAEATKKDRGSQFVLRIFLIPGIAVLVLSPRIAPAAEIRPPLASAVIGIVIFAAGEALRVWSKITLGRYFTYAVMTSSDQPVITSGPYRILRHPSYTGLLLMAIGAGSDGGTGSGWVR